jgi:predicted metal-dependent peptidase
MKVIALKDVPEKVRNILSTVRIGLATKPEHTFFVSVMMRLNINFSKDIDTACTDGLNIFFNPDFVESLTLPEASFLFMHETMHVVYKHIHRRGSRDPKLWNIAGDYIINNELDHKGFKFIKGGCLDHKYDGLSTDAIYARLKEKQDNQEDVGEPTFDDLGLPPNSEEPDTNSDSSSNKAKGASTEEIDAQLQDTIDGAIIQAQQGNSQSHGSIPQEILRDFNERKKPAIDWRKQLAQFMFSTGKQGLSYKRPSRRGLALGVTLPGKLGKGLGRIDFAIDTSGSVSHEMFQQFISEISYIFERMQPKQIGIMQFDHNLKSHDCINKPSQFKEIKFKGGGGTCVEPVIEEFINNSKSKALVVLTDGYFNTHLTNPNKPVIWAIYDNPVWVPPFGSAVHFKMSDLNKRNS